MIIGVFMFYNVPRYLCQAGIEKQKQSLTTK